MLAAGKRQGNNDSRSTIERGNREGIHTRTVTSFAIRE
jgi:hypothetical protein